MPKPPTRGLPLSGGSYSLSPQLTDRQLGLLHFMVYEKNGSLVRGADFDVACERFSIRSNSSLDVIMATLRTKGLVYSVGRSTVHPARWSATTLATRVAAAYNKEIENDRNQDPD